MGAVSPDILQETLAHLSERGYAVIENALDADEVAHYRALLDELFERERRQPWSPEDGPAGPDDAQIEQFLRQSYDVSQTELARLMRRIRHTRALNRDTPWPVPPEQVAKNFLHLPTLFDQDQSQRVWQLVAKASDVGRLIEDPTILGLAQKVLGPDCVLAEASATSIGPHTDGGAWHVDVPLGQLPEPLPDFPLTVQNVWMMDDFRVENGATQVVVDSHLTRRKPAWGEGQENAIALEAPAGSVAIWLSNTWHRSGPNATERPRRAVICYYSRSWIKPFTDYVSSIDPHMAREFSPQLRYLLGFSAHPPPRRG